MRSWVIGSSIDCEVVVDSPLASARHCQLTQTPEGFLLNDLGSTNGTYINGARIAEPVRLTEGDSITLGRTVPFPWPLELTKSIRIGRLADNDIVLDDPRVSGHHARLIVLAGFQRLIEDVASSNGTFLNSADRRVTGPTPIADSDTLYFGTLAVPAAHLLTASIKPETTTPAQTSASAVTEPLPGPTLPLPTVAFWERHRWLLAWLAQAPVLAVLIVLIVGRQSGAANGESIGQAIAAASFALALAAIWLGCSLAVTEIAAGGSPPIRNGNRLCGLTTLCIVACAVLLAGVYWGAGLKGPWPAMWGVLVMTSLVGFFLGLVASNPVRNKAAAASVLLICFVAMTALSGWIRPLWKMNPPVQLIAEAMPSRWAFEGLLLLEADQHRAIAAADESDAAPDHDLAEEFFPADSARMGVSADAMALGSMAIGLAALALFISGLSRRPGP
jgi:pSer/pThr/pTyr-binding forkhead associated (FHA) protein